MNFPPRGWVLTGRPRKLEVVYVYDQEKATSGVPEDRWPVGYRSVTQAEQPLGAFGLPEGPCVWVAIEGLVKDDDWALVTTINP